ncbi:hypothetical protein [Avibacterium paragallinarum]|uniref:hypothetical protein n=1 Tax=Avibacterium paragallinarum TaxID=728 RepID=UPI00397B6E12
MKIYLITVFRMILLASCSVIFMTFNVYATQEEKSDAMHYFECRASNEELENCKKEQIGKEKIICCYPENCYQYIGEIKALDNH